MALPAHYENFSLFQQHDAVCRQYASQQTPAQSGNKGGEAAALGTGVGAAAGALIGSTFARVGSGAAIGAGAGLLAGGLAGVASTRSDQAAAQNRYDIAYAQCMAGHGEQIAQPAKPVSAYSAF
jgi:uncharacterized protein YcfJ